MSVLEKRDILPRGQPEGRVWGPGVLRGENRGRRNTGQRDRGTEGTQTGETNPKGQCRPGQGNKDSSEEESPAGQMGDKQGLRPQPGEPCTQGELALPSSFRSCPAAERVPCAGAQQQPTQPRLPAS